MRNMTTERQGDQLGLVPFSEGLPVEFRAPVARITQFSDNQDTRTALVVLPDQTRAGIAARYNSAGSLLNAFEAGLEGKYYKDTDFKRNNLTGDQVSRALHRTQDAIASGLLIYPVAAQDLIDKQADVVGDVLGVLRSRTSMSPFFPRREETEDPQEYAARQEHHREMFAYTQDWAVDVQRSLLEGLGSQLGLGVRILEQGYLVPEMEQGLDESAIDQVNRTNLIYMHI